MSTLTFIDEQGSFLIEKPENISFLYFPLASVKGLKSSVTPNLGGDAKIDQETFLLEPVSGENLHNNRSGRNFWCILDGKQVYSAAGASAGQEAARFTPVQDESEIKAGLMWHIMSRSSQSCRLASTALSFIPWDKNVEILYISVTNQADHARSLTACAAVPLYGRSADNLRDHRNVTSMLHRIQVCDSGVLVTPTMSFDEKGHRPNHCTYYVMGYTGQGGLPESFYPTVEDFIGEGGTFTHPRSVCESYPGCPSGSNAAGKEAMGAFRFETVSLAPKETADYIVLLGAENDQEEIAAIARQFNTAEKVKKAFEETRDYWKNQVSASFHTGNRDFDAWMKWICFQPFLSRPRNFPILTMSLLRMQQNLILLTNLKTLSPYFVNTLYALDRAVTVKTLLAPSLEEGRDVLLDRYTTSSLIYQSSFITDKTEKQKFIEYVTDFEYSKLGIPKPDTVLFLNAPYECAESLRKSRTSNDGVEHDIHESNGGFMKKVYDSAQLVCDMCAFTRIDCTDADGRMYSRETIHEKIMSALKDSGIKI